MRDTCMRTKIKFMGTNSDELNSKQNEWLEFLPEINKEKCVNCEQGQADYCGSNISGYIELQLEYQSETIVEVEEENVFFFMEKRDCEEFARMLFNFFNNDASTIELDYADLAQYFSSSNQHQNQIRTLRKKELSGINIGSIVCFSIMSNADNALENIYKIAEEVECLIGDEVIFLIADLTVPKIGISETLFFHI
ncbi:MAG: hypothetical protein JJE17_03960 [Peptostreptococcaceae bacterium]|nr:hypothetical protein [Peptostreptococcaceae bacterium]